jgi:hypothetical protein
MFLSDWHVLIRRWYLVLAGLLVTSGLCIGAARLVPVTYVATAQVLLLPPRASDGIGANPYLSLGGLDSMVDVVARAMMDEATSTQLLKTGVSDTFLVARDLATAGPILLVTTEETSPAKARASLHLVTSQVPITTAKLQTDNAVKQPILITTALIGVAGEPRSSQKKQIRTVLVAMVGGLTLTVLSVSLVDSWFRRRKRRESSSVEAAVPTAPPAGDAGPPGLVSSWGGLLEGQSGASGNRVDGDHGPGLRSGSGSGSGSSVVSSAAAPSSGEALTEAIPNILGRVADARPAPAPAAPAAERDAAWSVLPSSPSRANDAATGDAIGDPIPERSGAGWPTSTPPGPQDRSDSTRQFALAELLGAAELAAAGRSADPARPDDVPEAADDGPYPDAEVSTRSSWADAHRSPHSGS